MELTYKHINWLLIHLTMSEYGTYAEVDLSEEAQVLVSWGYASMRPCSFLRYRASKNIFSVSTSSKGMELLETNYKVEYALYLFKVDRPYKALAMIRSMSEQELPTFLVHPEWLVREIARRRLERLTSGIN